jgi:hypothetical protein
MGGISLPELDTTRREGNPGRPKQQQHTTAPPEDAEKVHAVVFLKQAVWRWRRDVKLEMGLA